jgi:hypothetical protein
VHRFYDTRFRYTHRRPDLYAKFAPPKDGVIGADPDVTLVCRISDRDGDATLDNATHVELRDDRRPTKDALEMMDWMWSFVGVMVVISIPFVDGRHFALAIEDFIPVIKFLQKMHAAGYVHGDIRCFNIVFGKCLIDFDFGGKADDDDTTYPAGYVKELRDGFRIGEGGDK